VTSAPYKTRVDPDTAIGCAGFRHPDGLPGSCTGRCSHPIDHQLSSDLNRMGAEGTVALSTTSYGPPWG